MVDATTHQDAGAAAATAPVTVEQAATILGVSATTVRRRIHAGTLRAEEVSRPQGVVWLVHLPADATPGTTKPPPAASTVATTATAAAGDQMIAYTRTLLEPLVGALERSQARVGELERENGRLAAELEALRGSQTHTAGQQTVQAPDLTMEAPEPPARPEPLTPAPIPSEPNGHTPWWRRWPWDGPLWLLLTVLLLLLLAAVALWVALEAQALTRLT
jgi:excisionase family DNA binding protein